MKPHLEDADVNQTSTDYRSLYNYAEEDHSGSVKSEECDPEEEKEELPKAESLI